RPNCLQSGGVVQTLGAAGSIPAGDYQNASASLTHSSREACPHRAPLFPGPLRGLSLSMGLAIRYQTPCRSPIRIMLIRGFRFYILFIIRDTLVHPRFPV